MTPFSRKSSSRGRRDGAPRRRTDPAAKSQSDTKSSDESSQYAFRRNRTLTGSSSPNVASSNEMKAELRSPRAHVHHLSSLRRMLLAYMAGALLVSGFLYLMLFQLAGTTVAQVDGAIPNEDEQEAYQETFDRYYAARPIERLRFLLSPSDFLTHIQSSHPEVKAVSVGPGAGLGEATISITPRSAIARWSIAGKTSFVDSAGIVFVKNYGDAPSVRIIDNSGIRVSGNRVVASNRFLGFVGRVIAEADRQRIAVTRVTIPPLTTRQVVAHVKGQRTVYRLSVDRSPEAQAEDVSRVSRYLKREGLRPSYVDVRVKGKAFYR